MTIFIIPN